MFKIMSLLLSYLICSTILVLKWRQVSPIQLELQLAQVNLYTRKDFKLKTSLMLKFSLQNSLQSKAKIKLYESKDVAVIAWLKRRMIEWRNIMTETRRLKNFVIFIQINLSFMLSRKIILNICSKFTEEYSCHSVI